MTVVYELPRDEIALHARLPFEDMHEVEQSLVKRGTDTTRALFAAAQMVHELHHGHAAVDTPEGYRKFLVTMGLLSYKNIVLAGETESVDDIQGVGTYHFYDANFEAKTATIVDLYMKQRHRNKGVGAQIVNHIEHAVAAEGAEFIAVTSSFAAIPFYVRSGYQAQSHTSNGLYKRLR